MTTTSQGCLRVLKTPVNRIRCQTVDGGTEFPPWSPLTERNPQLQSHSERLKYSTVNEINRTNNHSIWDNNRARAQSEYNNN